MTDDLTQSPQRHPTIRESLRVLLALRLTRRANKHGLRTKFANYLVYGAHQHRRPTPIYIDPRVLRGEMSFDDPTQKTTP
jgi:hypothetical protein